MVKAKEIVERAMREIDAQEDWAGWGDINYSTATPTEVAGWYSSYRSWDGCAGSTLESRRIWVVHKDGSWQEVPYGFYSQEYASNHDPNYYEEDDVYVADYLTEDTIAIIVRDRTYVDVEGRDYENETKTTVYFLQPIPQEEERALKEALKKKIDELPITELLSLLERVGITVE